MRHGNSLQISFCFFRKALYQVKASGLELHFTIFRQPSNQHTIETNCLKLCGIDPEISSILTFCIRVWEQFLQHILRKKRKCSSSYIVLTDQISLSGYLYFLRYWAIYILQLFVKHFKINLIFLIKPFLYMNKKVKTKA